MSKSRRPVVVGVDGSTSSTAAVEWAAEEARSRNCPLRIVHAFVWPLLHVPLGPALDAPADGGLRADARRLVASAVKRAKEVVPDLEVSIHMPVSMPGTALVAESRNAVLLVLGSRGLGGFSGILVGSTAVQAVSHAGCPLIVVRPSASEISSTLSRGRIVVGIDGSRSCVEAVELAMAEASRTGSDLLAVTVIPSLPLVGPSGDVVPMDEEPDYARGLSEALAGWREKYPDVEVHPVLLRGRPARTLVELSDGARLVVVGSRGLGGFSGLLLGSTSHTVLYHAKCPVAVASVRPEPPSPLC